MGKNAYVDNGTVYFNRAPTYSIFDSVEEAMKRKPKKLSPLLSLGVLNVTAYYYYLEPFVATPFYVSSFSLALFSLLQFANLTQGKSEICSLALQMNLEKV